MSFFFILPLSQTFFSSLNFRTQEVTLIVRLYEIALTLTIDSPSRFSLLENWTTQNSRVVLPSSSSQLLILFCSVHIFYIFRRKVLVKIYELLLSKRLLNYIPYTKWEALWKERKETRNLSKWSRSWMVTSIIREKYFEESNREIRVQLEFKCVDFRFETLTCTNFHR